MILFTADWHIKLGQKNVPIEWQRNRFLMFFEKIEQIPNVELHVIGGDIFDKMPTLDELALFFVFVKNTKIKTIIFDGNHEATKKGATFFTILKPLIETMNPLIEVVDDYYSNGLFDIIPYCKLKQFEKQKDFYPQSEVLFTHVRGNIPPHVHSEVDLSIFKDWKTVFAGDLHSHENSQENIIYPGSPMTVSFHRSKTTNGCILWDKAEKFVFVDLELPQLLRFTIYEEAQAIADNYHHIIFDIEGDLEDLAGMAENPLIDKKLVKRNQELALILTPEMTLSQEVEEYLRYILQLKEDTIKEVMQVFHDNVKNY